MLRYIRKFAGDVKDRGASAVEYGLMVAAIAAVIVAIVFGLGGLVRETFQDTCQSIQDGAQDLAAQCADDGGGGGGGDQDPDPNDGN